MEKLLRDCYNELKIYGANKPLFEKRENAIQTILDNEILTREEYEILTYWLMGIAESPKDILIKLEGEFCEYDESFSLLREENVTAENKEIQMLCIILLYQYCGREDDYEFPVRILCGDGVGYKLRSDIMLNKFKNMVSDWRISIRKTKDFSMLKKMLGFSDIKKAINTAIEEETEYDIGAADKKKILEQIEICQKNIKILQTNEELYCLNMQAKDEEINILWWMLNGWSDCYKEMYRSMTVKEAALTVPIELYNLVKFELYPYATEQMIRKILFDTKEYTEEEYSLCDMMKAARKELTNNHILKLDKTKIDAKIQPILYALTIKSETEKEEEWPLLFRIEAGYEMSEITMSCLKFSLQMCRELELFRYSEEEA